MHQQSSSQKAPLSTVAKNHNIQITNQPKPKKLVGSPVTNKFFKSSISSFLPLKPIMNKSNNKAQQLTDQKINHSSIIYSEDVSRKKLKLDEKYRKKRYCSILNDNTEDFLENLKKNYDKKSMSQPVLENDVQIKQKSQPRRKPLFTDESLNLMSNFKKYFKDNILQDPSGQEISEMSNMNKSSSVTNQENIANQIDTIENYNSSNFNYRTPSRECRLSNFEIPMTSNCSTVLVRNDNLFSSGSVFRHSEMGTGEMFSPLRTPDLSFKSRVTMLKNMNNHTDKLSSPNLPRVDDSSFQFSFHSDEHNVKNSNFQSYFQLTE